MNPTFVQAQGEEACTGFGCGETTSASYTVNTPCSGFGCHEEHEDKHINNSDNSNCSPLTLDLSIGTLRQDTTILNLECDGQSIWNFEPEKSTSPTRLTFCVSPEDCCDFHMNDNYVPAKEQSQFTVTNDGDDELAVLLSFDGDLLVSYDSTKDRPLESLSKTFGHACTTPASQQDSKPCNSQKQISASFQIELDSYPEETSWYLMCDTPSIAGDSNDLTTFWNVPRKSFKKANEIIQQNACVPKESTCAFTIVDTASNGLQSGGYRFIVDGQELGTYDSSMGDFSDKTYCLGPACQQSTIITTPQDTETWSYGGSDVALPTESDTATALGTTTTPIESEHGDHHRWPNHDLFGYGTESQEDADTLKRWAYAMAGVICFVIVVLVVSFTLCIGRNTAATSPLNLPEQKSKKDLSGHDVEKQMSETTENEEDGEMVNISIT